MPHPIEHPWQLAQSIWVKTVGLGTGIYVVLAAATEGLQATIVWSTVGLMAGIASCPTILWLWFWLPVLELPTVGQRYFWLLLVVLSGFLLAILLLSIVLFFSEASTLSWQYLGLIVAFASPYLLAALVATWHTCRPWLAAGSGGDALSPGSNSNDTNS